jgi:hypothetical protein
LQGFQEEGEKVATEKNFENKVKKFLKDEGCYFIKYWGGGEFTKAGVPDVLACVDGFFFGIEIKAPKGKPSPLQIHNLQQIDESGGFAVLLYPIDFELFQNLVKCIKADWEEGITANYSTLKERWWKEWEKLHK